MLLGWNFLEQYKTKGRYHEMKAISPILSRHRNHNRNRNRNRT